jgi:hypothetical protein
LALTSAAGILAFGPQVAKTTTATTFYRHRAVDIDLSINDDVRLGQLEVGGVPVPTFPYKAGYIIGGGAVIQPRLEDTFGWLLYGAMGKCTSTPDDDPSDSGVYDHVFEMATADASYVPWMSFRKVIPRKDGVATTDLGETYTDCKVLGLGFQMPTDAPLTCRVDVIGRTFELANDPTAWVYANTFEDWQSIPVACMTGGHLKIGGDTLPIAGASFAWTNQPLDPRAERVYGSPALDDVTILSRQLAFDIMVKYNNPDLYREVLTGSVSGTVWGGEPMVGSFDAKMVSAKNMPSISEPYSLRVEAPSAMMTQVGGIRLAAGQAVMMRFQGTIIEGTESYATMTLRNKQANYTWPT